MMFAYEKVGGRPQPRRLLEGFRNTINDCGLYDIGFRGSEFTWERARGTTSWIQERLDQGMANYEWKNMFPRAELKVLEVSTSDHLPIFLDLKTKVYAQKTRRF